MADSRLSVRGDFDDNISPHLKSIESGIIRVVGAFSAMSTALATLGAPILVAAEFQKQMLEVKKTTDFSASSIGYLSGQLVQLSRDINVLAPDLAKIAAMGGQLGIGARGPQALLAFTEEISRAVTALDVDAETAAISLGKLVNIFNIDPSQYRNVIGVINQLSNISTARPEELFDIMRRLGNLGGSATVDQVAALSAVMIDLGLTAETAGTSMTKIFADMKASAGDFANFVGMSTAEWSDKVEKDGIGALTLYLERLNAMPPAIAAATKAQLSGEGRLFGLVTKLQEEVAKGGGLLASRLASASAELVTGASALREQQSVLSGLSAQWQIFGNNVRALGIASGEETLAPLTRTLRTLSAALADQEVIDSFTRAAKLLVDTLSAVVDAVVSVTSSLAGIGVDWGRLLEVGGLLLVVKLLGLAGRGISSFGAAIASSMSTAEAKGTSSANSTARAWNSVASAISGVADKYVAAAAAARASAQEQVLAATRAASADARIAAGAAARNVVGAARKYADSGLRQLSEKTIAGTITLEERTEFQNRLHNYQFMMRGMDEALRVHTMNERQVMGLITRVHSAEVKARLREYLAALQAQRLAAEAAGIATAEASMRPMPVAWTAQAAPSPTILSRFLAFSGYLDKVHASSGKVTKALYLLAASVSAVGKVVGFVVSRLLSWASWAVVLAYLGSELLSFFGVLKQVQDVIWSILRAMGVKKRPEWLGGEETAKEAIALRKAYNEVMADRQKFEQRFGGVGISTTITLDGQYEFEKDLTALEKRMVDARKAAAAGMTFDITDTRKSVNTFVRSLADIEALGSGVRGADAEYMKLRSAADEAGRSLTLLRMAYDSLVESGNADNAMLQAKSLEIAEAETRYGQLRQAAVNAQDALTVQARALEQQSKVTLSYLTAPVATALFDQPVEGAKSLMEALLALSKKQAEFADEARRLGIQDLNTAIPVEDDSRTPAQIARLQELRSAYQQTERQIAKYKEQALNTPGVRQLFPDSATAAAALEAMATQADQLAKTVREVSATSGGLDSVAKGLGRIMLPEGLSVDQLAGRISIAMEARKAYNELAAIAAARAEDAKGSVARAIDRNKQDYKEFAEFLVRTKRNLETQMERAAAQLRSRGIDDGEQARQEGLSQAKALENDILNIIKEQGFISNADIQDRLRGLEEARSYGQSELYQMLLRGQISKDTFDREYRALNDSVMMQKDILDYYSTRGRMTEAEASAIQKVLDLKYRAADRKIVDEADTQRAKANLDSIGTAFQRLAAEGESSRATLERINNELRSDAVPNDQKVRLLEERDQAQARLASTLGLMRAEAEKFSAVDPVAGKVLVDPVKVSAMEASIRRLTDSMANLSIASAGQESGIWEKQKNALAAVSAALGAVIDKSVDSARAMNVPTESLLNYAAAARELPAVAKQVEEAMKLIGESAARGTVGVDSRAVIASIEQAVATIPKEAFSGLPPAELEARLKESSLSALRADFSRYLTQAAKDAEESINAAGGLKLKATITADSVQVGGQSVATPLRNADGGPIVGDGGYRSDSILSWLSHGEWVVDARTVRMFGGGFFATLRDLAARGTNLSGLRGALPRFAAGGGVSIPGFVGIPSGGFSGLQSIAEGGDTVSVELSMNGKRRSRLRGTRADVEGFVAAVRELQKGMAE